MKFSVCTFCMKMSKQTQKHISKLYMIAKWADCSYTVGIIWPKIYFAEHILFFEN